MTWLKAILEIFAHALGLWKRKSDTQNSPEMKEAAKQQQAQAATDDIAATTQKAMNGKTQAERDAALAEARRQDAE